MALHGHYHLLRQGLAADRPATPGYDLAYYATDTAVLSIYDTVGAAWTTIGASLPLSITNGGTGQTTATAAFNALDPLTTKGDVLTHDGTNSIRLAAGTNQKLILYDSGQTSGLRQEYNNTHVTLFSHAVFVTFIPGAAYAPFGGATSPCRMKMNFTPFREARIIVRAAKSNVIYTSVDLKIVDTTNTQDMTNTVTVSSTTISTQTSTWMSLNSATYGGDAEFECQGIEAAIGDRIDVSNIQLELR